MLFSHDERNYSYIARMICSISKTRGLSVEVISKSSTYTAICTPFTTLLKIEIYLGLMVNPCLTSVLASEWYDNRPTQ